eukprot:200787-Prorocentrum_lima.AAC.1
MTSSLVGSEMCIRDRCSGRCPGTFSNGTALPHLRQMVLNQRGWSWALACLLYTSDAADDM